jgi:hypothetical protein
LDKKFSASGAGRGNPQPPRLAEIRDVDDHEEQEPAAFADRFRRFDSDRYPDQLNQLAAICAGNVRPVSQEVRQRRYRQNRLILLIAG